jgi:hypothetical protein
MIEDLLLFIDKNTWRLLNGYGIEVGSGAVMGDFRSFASISLRLEPIDVEINL